MEQINEFINYLDKATTPIQGVSASIEKLEAAGFDELKMGDGWKLETGDAYYIRPYPTTLVAFRVGIVDHTQQGFRIITSHTDTPGFKVKPNPEMTTKGYLKMNTEVYCQPMFYSWLDRPLSVAGHVVLKSDSVFKPKIVNVDVRYPLMTIPSLAIHFNREVNKGVSFNPQKDMLPLMSLLKDELEAENFLLNILAKESSCNVQDILDYDLYVYVQEKGRRIGRDQDLVSAPRVDNQASVYTSIEALINSELNSGISMAVCFDNEEIGSATKQGADSMLLLQILERIAMALGKVGDQLYRMFDQSFLVSADGAHALHPNYEEKNDPTNLPIINQGIVIKVSARQSYTTDGISGGIFKRLCEQNDINYQYLVNRSDVLGGRTLGQMAAKYVPIKGVDVGIPMLGMHSARELFGEKDFVDLIKVFECFYGYKEA